MEEKDTCKRCRQQFLFPEDLKDGVCSECRKREDRRNRELLETIRASRLHDQVFDVTTDDTIPVL